MAHLFRKPPAGFGAESILRKALRAGSKVEPGQQMLRK